ncbi:MAG: hypothetical protein EB147_06210 [Acidimicrobiia bacterium]|jgi:hypothetical protein|nr:hypothetical protein [Acidimicrobiia bacterium]NDD95930.1 hypothetical protein [Actinomycetota bacterium]NDE80492.1 hypothetical protein [Actinomycetota bacterium]NDF31806.1 hypothetical protein [Acidimicrobiia bacterium]
MNNAPLSERIDELASRLVDGDVEIDMIESSLRDDVLRRASQFRDVRSTLSRSRQLTVTTTDSVVARTMAASRPRRRVTTYVAGLAVAAAVSTIVGVAVTSVTSSDRSDEPTRDAASNEPTTFEADVAVAAVASDVAVASDAAREGAIGDVCPDELRRTIIPLATIDGESVEIHWSPTDGVVIYRISDCSIQFATTP